MARAAWVHLGLVGLAILALAAPRGAAAADGPATGSAEARFGLHYKPVDFNPPAVNTAELGNGISLHHYAEKEVPLVTVLVRVGVGSIDDPAGKAGATAMTGTVIRNGGSEKLSGDDLDRALESRGADLSVSTSREETWFRLSVLPEDLDWGMGILSDLLAHPRLPEAKLAEARARRDVDLRQRLDVPLDSSQALFPQLIYGKGNPWGTTQTSQSLGRLGVDDLKAIYKTYYRPGRMMLGLAGDVDFDQAQSLAKKYFGPAAYAPEAKVKRALPDVTPTTQTRVYIAARPVTQNVIYFGHLGIQRFAPEKFAVRLFNEVLSGGFTSRLMKEVRSDRGLAYLVYGNLGEGSVRGIFYNVALTKVATTSETLSVMMDVDRSMQQKAPTASEIEQARQATVNSFVFLFDTAEQIVRQQMTLDALGYPKDYLQTWVANVEKVTPEDVLAAARKDLHLDRVTVLVFGSVDDNLKSQLAKLGPVRVISDQELRQDWL